MQAHYAATLSHSFSMPSLAEGSEPISEAEEINEVGDSYRKTGLERDILSFLSIEVIRVNFFLNCLELY